VLQTILNHIITKVSLIGLFILGLIVVIFPECFEFSATYHHYANQIMFGYLMSGLFFLIFRQKTLMTLSFGCCVLLCFYLKLAVDVEGTGFNNLRQTTIREDIPTRFSVAHFNLGAGTSEKAILEGIRNADADFVSIQEIRPDWLDRISDSLSKEYRFYQTLTDMRMLSMGVFARRPLLEFDTVYHNGLANPCGSFEVGKKGEQIHFISTNTLPVFSESLYGKLQNHINTLASHLDTCHSPAIALGDFNAVPWSNIIQEFEEQTGLKDSRQGFMDFIKGGTKKIFDVPLNHIFYSKHLKCIDFEPILSPNSAFSAIKGVYEFKTTPTNASQSIQ